MEGKKLLNSALGLMLLVMMMLSSMGSITAIAYGNGCKDCIVEQVRYGCPSCVPLIRCMARCLWGVSARSSCISRCDGGKPTLSDCKKCMSRCKCSCVA
ncbi:hypothetical protein ERO13_D10G009100v2 [Gossypium hirsutum]|uniref:Uncharacterized protein n=2 Tax=Gossypium TaxID=3633 RepID=A0A5D2T364_GOSMU|nr:hypothetical protein ERO13_D10G009100v2 [Gossypium hirsutum]TYH47624.1 hypothetical protein ES332_D10G010700v1 [Gossypium tomentosum]TYI59095.1 hypothetical protein E1A91_D10G010000v1 [Gossypium mustelinum]